MAINSLSTGFRPGVCTSSTRPTAPYEGQVIYETDTDLSYVWGGAAWQQVSGGTAVGNSGLVYVAGGALSTSATNFLGCFNSTYTNYRIVIDNAAASAAADIYVKYIVGTTVTTASNYYWSYRGLTSGGSSQDSSTNAAGGGYTGWTTPGTGGQGGVVLDIFCPNVAKSTITAGQASFLGSGVYGHRSGSFAWDGSDLFTGIQFTSLTGATLSGNVSIYGYRK